MPKNVERLCECHGEAMYWHNRSSPREGSWECRVKNREYRRKHRLNHLERDQKQQREYRRKLWATDPFYRMRKVQDNRRRAAQKRKERRLAEDQTY